MFKIKATKQIVEIIVFNLVFIEYSPFKICISRDLSYLQFLGNPSLSCSYFKKSEDCLTFVVSSILFNLTLI